MDSDYHIKAGATLWRVRKVKHCGESLECGAWSTHLFCVQTNTLWYIQRSSTKNNTLRLTQQKICSKLPT